LTIIKIILHWILAGGRGGLDLGVNCMGTPLNTITTILIINYWRRLLFYMFKAFFLIISLLIPLTRESELTPGHLKADAEFKVPFKGKITIRFGPKITAFGAFFGKDFRHYQIVFADGSNVGYYSDGVHPDRDPERFKALPGFMFVGDMNLMKQAVENIKPRFTAENYRATDSFWMKWFDRKGWNRGEYRHNNCQDFAKAAFEEYVRIGGDAHDIEIIVTQAEVWPNAMPNINNNKFNNNDQSESPGGRPKGRDDALLDFLFNGHRDTDREIDFSKKNNEEFDGNGGNGPTDANTNISRFNEAFNRWNEEDGEAVAFLYNSLGILLGYEEAVINLNINGVDIGFMSANGFSSNTDLDNAKQGYSVKMITSVDLDNPSNTRVGIGGNIDGKYKAGASFALNDLANPRLSVAADLGKNVEAEVGADLNDLTNPRLGANFNVGNVRINVGFNPMGLFNQ
jgi:hypothetical protein